MRKKTVGKIKRKGNKSALKRFRVTKKGKFLREKAGASHLLSGKRAKRRRKLRRTGAVSRVDTPRVRRILAGTY